MAITEPKASQETTRPLSHFGGAQDVVKDGSWMAVCGVADEAKGSAVVVVAVKVIAPKLSIEGMPSLIGMLRGVGCR